MRHLLPTVRLLLVALGLTACVSPSGPGADDLAAVSASKGSIALLRVVVTSNAGPLPAFGESLESQCIGVGLSDRDDEGQVSAIDDLDSFSDETLAAGWLWVLLSPGEHVVAFNPPRMWDPRADGERWDDTTHWKFEVPQDTPVVYLGTMQLHCRAEASDFGGARIRDIRAEKLHDQSRAATEIAARFLPDLPPPRTLPMTRLYARESSILGETP